MSFPNRSAQRLLRMSLWINQCGKCGVFFVFFSLPVAAFTLRRKQYKGGVMADETVTSSLPKSIWNCRMWLFVLPVLLVQQYLVLWVTMYERLISAVTLHTENVFVCTWLVLHVKAIKVYLDASDDIDSCIRIRSSYQPQFTKLQTRLPWNLPFDNCGPCSSNLEKLWLDFNTVCWEYSCQPAECQLLWHFQHE